MSKSIPFGFSAALCCGLIEARQDASEKCQGVAFSAALCCGLIEAMSQPM
mgnify:CR=1 FL=1